MILALIFAGVMFLIYKLVIQKPSKNEFGITSQKPLKGYTNVSIPNSLLDAKDSEEFLIKHIYEHLRGVVDDIKSLHLSSYDEDITVLAAVKTSHQLYLSTASELAQETNLPLSKVNSVINFCFNRIYSKINYTS